MNNINNIRNESCNFQITAETEANKGNSRIEAPVVQFPKFPPVLRAWPQVAIPFHSAMLASPGRHDGRVVLRANLIVRKSNQAVGTLQNVALHSNNTLAFHNMYKVRAVMGCLLCLVTALCVSQGSALGVLQLWGATLEVCPCFTSLCSYLSVSGQKTTQDDMIQLWIRHDGIPATVLEMEPSEGAEQVNFRCIIMFSLSYSL